MKGTTRHRSWWERRLPDAELAPPPARELPDAVDVLIVGAGFMGRWLARFLSRLPTPPRILVVERDGFGYGASTRNAGFLTCGQVSEMRADVEAVGLDAVVETFLRRLRGMEIVRGAFPDLEVEGGGSLDWDPLTEEKRALAETLNAEAGREIYRVREAAVEGGIRPAMFNAADGMLDPVRLLRRIGSDTAADFAFGVSAEEVGGGHAALRTARGPHALRYAHAFLCTNAFTPTLHAGSTVAPGRGQVIVTSPVETSVERSPGYLNEGYDYFRFVGDRLLIGGGRHAHPEENGPTELETTDAVGGYLREVAARVVGHDDFEVEHHWAGIMGFPEGRHLGGSPRVRIDDRTEAIAGFGGMGVALTPPTAEEVARDFDRRAAPPRSRSGARRVR